MYKIGDIVKDNDGDIAIIEEIKNNMFLLRFIGPIVQGVAYWYKQGNFEKIKNIETIKNSKELYEYLKINNKFRRF